MNLTAIVFVRYVVTGYNTLIQYFLHTVFTVKFSFLFFYLLETIKKIIVVVFFQGQIIIILIVVAGPSDGVGPTGRYLLCLFGKLALYLFYPPQSVNTY